MSTVVEPPRHPAWCDQSACEVATGGAHRSEPTRVNLRRGAAPRLLLLLSQRPGQPVMVRIVVVGDLLVNEVSILIDEAHLTAAGLLKLIERATPPPPPEHDGYPIGTRH